MESSKVRDTTQKLGVLGGIFLRQEYCLAIGSSVSKYRTSFLLYSFHFPCLRAFLIQAQAVDDDEISSEIPNEFPDGSRSGIGMAVAAIEHARICAKISKQILSARAFNQSPEALFNVMETLEKKLQMWRKTLPDHLTLPKQKHSLLLRKYDQRRTEILRLHYLYWGSVIALNANFHYPWISSLLARSESFFEDRLVKSSTRAAEASREILSTLKDTELDTSFSSP
jgi:hypothetical protein